MTKSLNRLFLPLVGAGALALSACSGTPSAEEVQKEVPDRTVSLLLAANASANKTAGGEAASTLIPSEEGSDTSDAALIVDDETAERNLERLRVYLRDRVFTAEHFEGTDDGMAVFLLTDTVCTEGTLPKDPACVKFLEDVDVRLGVSRESKDALAVKFMFGAERAAPFTYVAGKEALAFRLALGELHQTAEVLGLRGMALGTMLPDVLEGELEVALAKLGDEAFEATFGVLSDVRVEDRLVQGPISFTTEASNPLARLMVDGSNRAVQVGAQARKTVLSLPYRALVPNGRAGETLTFDLAGLNFELAGADGEPITATGVGLGDATSSVSLDGTSLVSVDVNADAGRAFDVVLGLLEGGVQELAVSPEFDLFVQLALEPLAVDQEIAPEFSNNSLQVTLGKDGNETPRLLVHPADFVSGEPGYFQLQPGTFVFALGSGERFEAATGDCFGAPSEGSEEEGASALPIDFVTCR